MVQAGDRGTSWVAVELYTEPVEVPDPPTEPPAPSTEPYPRERDRPSTRRFTIQNVDRTPVTFFTVRRSEDRTSASFVTVLRESTATSFTTKRRVEDRQVIAFSSSTKMSIIRQEDDDIMFLI